MFLLVDSRTLVSAGKSATRNIRARKILESLNDQENAGDGDLETPFACQDDSAKTDKGNPVANGVKAKSNDVIIPESVLGKKRKSEEKGNKQSKKAKQTTAVPKGNKKKPAALLKGQRKLTTFFRV